MGGVGAGVTLAVAGGGVGVPWDAGVGVGVPLSRETLSAGPGTPLLPGSGSISGLCWL